MENNELLAVYGTLKSGHINHHYLTGAGFIAEGAIEKNYGLICDELPFLVEDHNGPGCYVEIYSVSKKQLSEIDRLGGHPNFYKRTRINVINLDTGYSHSAWVYVYQGTKRGEYVRRF